MNTFQLSERESVANTQLQIRSPREPLEAAGSQQDFSRPAEPEGVCDGPPVSFARGHNIRPGRAAELNRIAHPPPRPRVLRYAPKPFEYPVREPTGDTATKTEVAVPAQPSTTTEVAEPVGGGPSNPVLSRTLHPGPERFDTRPESCEGAAQAAFESRAGRTLTDADWAVAKDRLLEFFTILRGWDRKARTVSRDLVMFEVPCL